MTRRYRVTETDYRSTQLRVARDDPTLSRDSTDYRSTQLRVARDDPTLRRFTSG
jgi:hypothetical protein